MSERIARIAFGVLLLGGCGVERLSAQQVAEFDSPSFDSWFYVNGIGPGTRPVAPSFSSLPIDDETNEFVRGDAFDPNRLASTLIAFETTDQIEAGLAPSRYQINSVTVTVRSQNGTVGDLLYTEQTSTPGELLTAAQGSSLGPQQPIELFGVGFRNGFEGFALGADLSGDRLSESMPLFDLTGGYNVFPVVGDGGDGYRDVSNNVSGGFSATEASGETDPFAATPWAVGTVSGLGEGDSVPDDTTFTFEIDLTQPGVLPYLQESLAGGAVGFTVSTLHQAVFPGDPGASPYPQWYTRDAVRLFEDFNLPAFAQAEAPSLSIDFAIVDASPPGDYDGDGDVDVDDFSEFVAGFGASVADPGDGADGSRDGVVNAADYTVFRDNASPADDILAPPAAAAAIPEPAAALLVTTFVASLSTFWSVRGRRVPQLEG